MEYAFFGQDGYISTLARKSFICFFKKSVKKLKEFWCHEGAFAKHHATSVISEKDDANGKVNSNVRICEIPRLSASNTPCEI
ncbi:MAG: hypothetical protein LBR91_02035 [Puniceicoccales bacterium]|jgi:hypothetical protein|nr:hypothetical protein [Puniceicoccales bacterium]